LRFEGAGGGVYEGHGDDEEELKYDDVGAEYGVLKEVPLGLLSSGGAGVDQLRAEKVERRTSASGGGDEAMAIVVGSRKRFVAETKACLAIGINGGKIKHSSAAGTCAAAKSGAKMRFHTTRVAAWGRRSGADFGVSDGGSTREGGGVSS
jgi:hypothetical protein